MCDAGEDAVAAALRRAAASPPPLTLEAARAASAEPYWTQAPGCGGMLVARMSRRLR
jgi:hypothetical protein